MDKRSRFFFRFENVTGGYCVATQYLLCNQQGLVVNAEIYKN